jgi:hypothetical protein
MIMALDERWADLSRHAATYARRLAMVPAEPPPVPVRPGAAGGEVHISVRPER